MNDVAFAVALLGKCTHTQGTNERRSGAFLHFGVKNADSQTLADKSVENTTDFDAFGNIIGSTGSFRGPFKYGGAFGCQEDGDHGLKLLGHRYYDSSTGRFLSRDSLRDGRNWFTYCGSNPLNRVDADGLQAVDKAGAAALLGPEANATWYSRIPSFIRWLARWGCKPIARRTATTGATISVTVNNPMVAPIARRMGEAATTYGTRVHQAFKDIDNNLGWVANRAIGGGSRLIPDGVNHNTQVVREYKPLGANLERAIKQGLRYVEELQKQFGGEWSLELQPYVEPITGAKSFYGGTRFGWTGL